MRRAACSLTLLTLLVLPGEVGAVPEIHAPAAYLLERDTGQVLFARHGHQPRRVASTTKLMTALVTLQRAQLDRTATVAPYRGSPGESTAGLRAGQRVTVRDLLRAMLLASANEAANSLAIDVAGSFSSFVDLMNRQARALHLHDTHYATPVGLDFPGNHSSAADLAQLADVLLRNPFFARTVASSSASLPSAGNRAVANLNDLVGRYRFVIGVKTGHTNAAGECLVGAGRRRGATVISVVLGERSMRARDADTLALLRFGLAMFRRTPVVRVGHVYASVPVAGARPLELRAARGASAVTQLGRGIRRRIVGVPPILAESLVKGARLGSLEAIAGARVIAKVPLIASRSVVVARAGRSLLRTARRPHRASGDASRRQRALR